MHRYIQLPFHADCFGPASPTHITVAKPAISADVELATGAITPKAGGHRRRNAPEVSVALHGIQEQVRETLDGPTTRLVHPSAGEVIFAGELMRACRAGDGVVGVVSMPGPRYDCIAAVLGTGSVLRLPASWGSPVESDGSFGACIAAACVHVFRTEQRSVRSVSVSIPGAHEPDLLVLGGRVFVLAGDKVFVIDARELPFGAPHAASQIAFTALAPAGAADAEPANVVFVLTSKVLVDHPRLKRLSLPRTAESPEVQKGDSVLIDDVREELPGIFRVYAWRRVGAGISARPPPPPVELGAPPVSPLPGVQPGTADVLPKVPRRAADSERLANLAERHGFRAPDLLLRLLRAREQNPVFRRWLDKFGLDAIEVRSLTGDWDADPCLLAFAGLGNGDEYCLYVYPPWCAEGHEPPVVEFLHETNFVEFSASTFEAFLGAELTKRVENEYAGTELAEMVKGELGLPSHALPLGTPQDWLPLDELARTPRPATPAASTLGKLRGLFSEPAASRTPLGVARELERVDSVAAERAFLRIYLLGREDGQKARDELERLYASLGWSFPLENLRAAPATRPPT